MRLQLNRFDSLPALMGVWPYSVLRQVVFAALTAGLLLGPASVIAQDDEGDLSAAQSTLQNMSINRLLELAAGGDPEAAFTLGLRYTAGDGVEQDITQGARWMEQAARMGLAPAQHNLGVMHVTGKGMPKDSTAAAHWFTEAANQGLVAAQFALGALYSQGDGVPQDVAKSTQWVYKAAQQGLARAQYNMGARYELGHGVDASQELALAWYRKAADQGYERAIARLAELGAPAKVIDLRPSPATAPAMPPSRAATRPQHSTEGLRDSSWLAAQNPRHYTLQLSTQTSRKGAEHFIRSEGLGDQAAYFAAETNGKTLYSVIYGVFPSRRDAEAAISQLPQALQAAGPWVRHLGSIQKAMLP